jgi:hypothetical protein
MRFESDFLNRAIGNSSVMKADHDLKCGLKFKKTGLKPFKPLIFDLNFADW